mgnify:CR=1 FL=1
MAGLTQLIGGLGKAYGGYKQKQFGEEEERQGQRKYKAQLRGFRRGQFDKKISAEKAREKTLAAELGAAALKRATESGATQQQQLAATGQRGDVRALPLMTQQSDQIERATQAAEQQAAQGILGAQSGFADYAAGVQASNESTRQQLEAMELARGTARFDAGRQTAFEGGQQMTEGAFEATAGVMNMAAGGMGGGMGGMAGGMMGGAPAGAKGMKVGRDMSDPRVAARVEDLEEMREGKARRKDIMKGEGTRKERRASAQEDIIRERAERKARNEKRKSGVKEETAPVKQEVPKGLEGLDLEFEDIVEEEAVVVPEKETESTDEETKAKFEQYVKDKKKTARKDKAARLFEALRAPADKFVAGFKKDKGGYVGEKGGVTKGEFSHEENPIDMVNEDGEKVGEVTGGEFVFNDEQSALMKELIERDEPETLIKFMRDLLSQPQFK